VGPEVLVPLLYERSADMVVSLLAVLKAGAGYVPLEPELPPLRLKGLLERLPCPVLLTQRSRLGELQAAGGFAGEVLCSEEWERLESESEADLGEAVAAEAVAYVNFTSGSTGQPKGVLVPQRGVVRLVKGADYLQIGPQDVLLQLSTYAWDAATFEIWGALLNGARLVLLERDQVLDFKTLAQVLRREAVTVLYLTTALFNRVVDEGLGMLSGLRCLIVGGERASAAHFARAAAELSGVELINEYGPTENTVFSTWHRVVGGEEAVAIGRPVANSTVYVLDGELRPVPLGVVGEIYLGGDGLARGYLGSAELTAAAFVPHPWGEGERVYRSGDLGRWGAEGELHFVGRADEQVKLRGHRIEPAEIEAALRAHERVKDAVVVLREKEGADKDLVAYVVGPEAGAPGVEELRRHLAARLPEYMVPAVFVALSELPLRSTGKVDRRRLPEVDGQRPGLAVSYRAPSTELESTVAQVWCEVLGLEAVGVEDNFFDLGGYSLKTIQVRSRLQRRLGLEVPLRLVFERPTVGQQAAALEQLRSGGAAGGPGLIPRLGPRAHYALSPAQRRLWFLQRLHPSNTYYNVVGRFLIEGPLDRAGFADAVQGLVARQESLRTSFTTVDDEPVQRVLSDFRLELPFHDLEALAEAERSGRVSALLAETSGRPFDLETPPVRAALLRLAAERHLFILAAHHIVLDGWSRFVVLRDLLRLYESEDRALPELAVRYVDYAAWQNERIEKGALEAEETYWLSRLHGELPELELPGARRPSGDGGFETRVETVEGEDAVAEGLRRLGQACDATPFMVQLAVLKAFLSRLTGQEDVLIGAPVAGRDRSELEGLVGTFVNTLVLRTDLSGDPTLEEVVSRVKQTCLEAYAHQEYPFDRLVQRLNPARDANHIPLLQVVFASGPAAALEAEADLRLTATGDVSGSGGGWKASGDVGLIVACVEEADGRLDWKLIYSADRFGADTMRSVKGKLSRFLTNVAGHA
jgi:amino acid adenylation domain-containing protein